jgi:acetyl-CoA acyltransferase
MMWGCTFPEAERELNIGRGVRLLSGLPQSSACATVNRWRGWSIQAIQVAGARSPWARATPSSRAGRTMSRVPMMGFNIIPLPSGSPDEVFDFVNVELTAERIAERYGLSRKDQEQFAFKSLAKAIKAQQAGKLADEIAPVKAGNAIVAVDGCVRETSPENLSISGFRSGRTER